MTEYDKMIRLLDMAWKLRDEIVPCLVGPPGIGKTAAVMQHAKAHGCGKVVKIVASRCVPSETVGMTMPDHEHRSMAIYNSMQLSSLVDGDILFLDELLEADQFVLSTLLTVIESREMADGTPLPDIQIIAATNDTVSPEQLKGNIRQRFMFQRFTCEPKATADYIKELTGIEVPDNVLAMVKCDGSDYNFLSPRSLTKLCAWVDAVDRDELKDLATTIDEMWKCSIGTSLANARIRRDADEMSPDKQVRNAVKMLLTEEQRSKYDFDDCTLEEMLDILQSLPDWASISSALASMEIREPEEINTDIQF